MKIRKGDKVMIITGKDKGKSGEVTMVNPVENRVVIAGLNIQKKAVKASDKNPKGGIIEVAKSIDASNVMVIDPKTKKPARIGYTLEVGKKERKYN